MKLNGKEVGSTGYGLMGKLQAPSYLGAHDECLTLLAGLTWRPEPTPTKDAIAAMRTALQQGAQAWNGGEFYGTPEYNSLHLLNAYFSQYPEDADKVVLSIKGGADPKTMHPTGDEAGVRRSVDTVLKLLDGKKKLDLFECARVDPNTPIEESIRVLAEYVKEGKLGGISLSETSAQSIRRASKVHKIDAVEIEFSMFATDAVENGVMQTCSELKIPIVAYSPLGRGFLVSLPYSTLMLMLATFERQLTASRPAN